MNRIVIFLGLNFKFINLIARKVLFVNTISAFEVKSRQS